MAHIRGKFSDFQNYKSIVAGIMEANDNLYNW